MPTESHQHLKQLEAESIRILRQVAADFERPVMLYSVGKDSSVLLHLAIKAFHPSKPPFPLLHVDTTFKFREMIKFRDDTAGRLGMELIVHTNPEGLAANINPFTHGSSRYTDIMKTQALKQALDAGKYDAAIGGARRDEEKSRAKERIFSHRSKNHTWDPKTSDPSCGRCTTRVLTRVKACACFHYRIGRNQISGCICSWRTFPSRSCTWRISVRWLNVTAHYSCWMTKGFPLKMVKNRKCDLSASAPWVVTR